MARIENRVTLSLSSNDEATVVLDWRELTRLSDADLAKVDVAEMNLVCAVGLPGAEVIDYDGCIRALNAWTVTVRNWTEAAYEKQFIVNPARYEHSEAIFRMSCLLSALQRRCGVRYDPGKLNPKLEDPFEFHEQFIHGVIQGPGGTCATLPVLYAGVARRLGYPLRLVRTKAHVFNRWEDTTTGERANIEGSGPSGFNVYPDEHYGKEWKYPVTPAEEKQFGYLKSLTPREELGEFIARRGHRWRDTGNYRQAIDCFIIAADLDEHHLTWPLAIVQTTKEWRRKLESVRPPMLPRVALKLSVYSRRWPQIPQSLEGSIRQLEAIEDVQNDAILTETLF